MAPNPDTQRYLLPPVSPHLQRPLAHLQPLLAKPGNPSVDVPRLIEQVAGAAQVEATIAIQSPAHWEQVIHGLSDAIDAILPMSIPAYPTEIWNSHPQPLVERGLPVLFWPLIEYDEPDFWRWAARDLLRTLGVDVRIIKNNQEGLARVKALALKRFLRLSKIVVFGEQNFPWNAHAVGDRVTQALGTQIVVRPLQDIRARYSKFSLLELEHVHLTRLAARYVEHHVRPEELNQAIRTYLAIREILEEEQAIGFGVNCFGDLVIHGGRDVPCLAQLLLREEGYIAACDGDFITMMSMALNTFFTDKPCMMSNLYPVSYVGALTDHFGDPLSPGEGYPRETWKNLARLAHCGFVGVVSPEMTSTGKTTLQDWGGTYEIKRDGRGCGADGDLIANHPITVISLGFDAKRLMVAQARVAETTRYPHLPHCEASALLEFRDLNGFVEAVSRDHVVVIYGDHLQDFETLADVLGLEYHLF